MLIIIIEKKTQQNTLLLKNKMTLIAYILPKLQTAKCVVRQMFKIFFSEYPSIANMLKGHTHC